MAKQIKYRRVRKLNNVTIILGLLLLMMGLTAWEVGPELLLRTETKRILKAKRDLFERNRSRFYGKEDALTKMKFELSRELRSAGVRDPAMECWIEEGNDYQVEFGVIYTQTFHWPFDLVAPTETVVRQSVQYTID